MNLDLSGWRARATPERPALWFAGRRFSYRELDERAKRLAARLAGLGVHRGERVAILALNHPAHFDLLLAAPKLGCVACPLNYRLSEPELRALLRQIEPALLFADAAHQALARALGPPLVALDDYESWLDGPAAPPPAPELGPDDTHMLLLTGGSTGLPKAAQLPYRQTLGNAGVTAAIWGVTADDRAIQCTPCFHAANNALSLPLLHAGGEVILMPRFDADEYLALAQRLRVTLMLMVPTMYQALAAAPGFAQARFEALRWALSGGAPLAPALARTYAQRGLPLKQGYGMTEVGVNCFSIETDQARAHPDSVGRPLPGVNAVIRRVDGSEAETGEVGELSVAGPYVFSGYFRDESETRAALREGWLWTGDLFRRDADGLHYVCGRRKEMYISGGENVFPIEVEYALAQCADVAECAVFAIPHPRWGEQGVAAVALRSGAGEASALRAELKTRLAAYKLPGQFLFLPALPKTGAGKIDKPALRRLYEQREAQVVAA